MFLTTLILCIVPYTAQCIDCTVSDKDTITHDDTVKINKVFSLSKLKQHTKDSINMINTDTLNTNSKSLKGIKSRKEKKLFIPNPNTAMWYGLVFPGLGQIYNRRYWKVPIVYGGFVGLGYGIVWNDRIYRKYKHYYKDMIDNNPNTKSYEELYEKYDRSVVTEARLKDMTDNYRRYRDLCIIGSVAFYAITVLDAFVDASLANFDISTDLSLRVSPVILETGTKELSPAISLNIHF